MRFFYLGLLFMALHVSGQAQDHQRVLFLGNSYTFFNNLPTLYADFCAVGGDTVDVASNTPGGYTLQGHSTNAQSLQLINQGNWDYVVLQEQSQIPSFPIAQVNAQCFPYAEDLDEAILAANPCAETVFYMTWGRKNGDAGNCPNWPPVCTYEGMDSLLYLRYMQMGHDNEALVSPVGAVWRFIRENFTGIELYDNDESHPSLAGSFAAACTFYSIIQRANPEFVAFDGGLNALHAAQIRYAARVVAYDSLSKWYVGNYDTTTVADFDFAQSGLNASFNNTSTNALESLWSFGDGDTSTATHPSHLYADTGNYLVRLVTFRCDSSDTAFSLLTLEASPVDSTDTTTNVVHSLTSTLHVYPTPVHDILYVDGLDNYGSIQLILSDLQGRPIQVLKTKNQSRVSMDLGQLKRGNYTLSIHCDGKHVVKSVIKT